MYPKVSIIITAHERENYLMAALESIKNQTADRKLFEVIVAKNFQNIEVDEYITQNGYINLYCAGSLAYKVSKSLELCNGEIITFLEDDDTYHKDRIKIIIEKFRDFPEISFYHNSLIEINESGGKIRRNHHPQVKKCMVINSQIIEKHLAYLVSRNVDFNNGCIALKKNILLKYLEIYINSTNLSSSFTDALYFLFSINSKGLIFIDSDVLTNIRRHDSASVKLTGDMLHIIEFYQRFNKDFLNVIQYIKKTMNLNETANKYITIKESKAELEKNINSFSSRVFLIYAFKKYVKSIKRPYGKYEILLSISFMISLISRNTGKKFLYQILHIA